MVATERHIADTDLSALFGIDIDGVPPTSEACGEDGVPIATVSDELTPDECRSVGALFRAAPALLAVLEEWLAPYAEISATNGAKYAAITGDHGLWELIGRSRALVRQVRGMGDAP